VSPRLKHLADCALVAVCLSAVPAISGCRWLGDADPAEQSSVIDADSLPTYQDDEDPALAANAPITPAHAGDEANAERLTAAALNGQDWQTRLAAIDALGNLGDAKSRATLRQLAVDRAEKIRIAAVSAMARLGEREAVFAAAEDDSWRVRLEVARALSGYPDRDGSDTARQLLDDPSAEVQRAVVAALERWPLREAGPIWIEALGKASYLPRVTAAEQLAAQWPAAAEFPVQGTPQQRAAAREELGRRFRQEFARQGDLESARSTLDARPAAPVDPRQLDHVERLVALQDVPGLIDYGPGLVEVLEHLVFDRHRVLPEVVYRDVLPRRETSFEVLDRLDSADPSQRRAAAGELAELAGRHPLRRLVARRLEQLLVAGKEQDPLVWANALTAVRGDCDAPAIRLAYAAMGDPSPEVRRRACENLAACPDPRHATVLVPALRDSSRAVVVAALLALGAAGRIDDTAPVRQLLLSADEALRLETAIALVQLGDPAGEAELTRLADATDPKVRCHAAVAMGRYPQPSYAPTLIRMLDDRVAVCRAALESLPKVVGYDVSISDGQFPTTTAQRVQRWKKAATGGRAQIPTTAGRAQTQPTPIDHDLPSRQTNTMIFPNPFDRSPPGP